MTDKKHTAEFVKKWMDGHEPDTFVKNQHGNFIYSAGPSSINLTTFFEMLLEDYLSETFKGIDKPTEFVDKVKKVHSALGLNIDCNNLDFVNAFIKKIDELQAENERLKKIALKALETIKVTAEANQEVLGYDLKDLIELCDKFKKEIKGE